MIILTTRQKSLINYLISKGKFVTSGELATHYCVSSRTIRKDLDMIEKFLEENQAVLIRKQGIGVYIDAKSNILKKITMILDESENRVYSKKEREMITVSLLLIYPTITFQKIADTCYVSKQTIINDFLDVKDLLNEAHIHVEKVQGIGMHIQGEENAIRRYFMDMVLCNEYASVIMEVCYHDTFMESYLNISKQLIIELEAATHYKFLQRQRVCLILAFMISRVENGNHLKETAGFNLLNEEIAKMSEVLKRYFHHKEEIEYVGSILASERVEGRIADGDEIFKEAYEISEYLIDALQKVHDFDRDSLKETINGLHLHMKAAIYCCRNNIHIRNELIEQVYYTIPVVYEFTKKELKEVEKQYGLIFDENEISYIALYLASIFETGIQESLRVRIMIICAFGLATSSILKARMYQIFGDCDIIGPCSIDEAKEYLKFETVDLVLSTNNFSAEDVSVIYIHPLLKQSDIDLIRSTLFQKSFSKMCSLFFSKHQDCKREIHYLKEYIPYEHTQICLDKTLFWEDAIRLAAKPLLENHLIEEQYVQAMINAVNDFGTYMVFTPKVAYVHARKEDGVYQNCVSLLVLNHEISFGSFNIKQVQMIVVFGITDKEQNHMISIANILDNKENVERFGMLKDIHSILNLHD